MVKAIKKANDGLCFIEKNVTWVVFLVLIFSMLAQVICRYFLHMTLAWAEEMSRYIYIWVSFFGACIASKEKTHITINIIPSLFGKFTKDERVLQRALDVTDIIAGVITTVFFIYISRLLINYTISLQVSGQFTVSNEWPMWLMCLPMTISCVIMGIHFLFNTILSVADLFSKERMEGLEEVSDE